MAYGCLPMTSGLQTLLKLLSQYNENIYNVMETFSMEMFNESFKLKKATFWVKCRLNGYQEGWKISIQSELDYF